MHTQVLPKALKVEQQDGSYGWIPILFVKGDMDSLIAQVSIKPSKTEDEAIRSAQGFMAENFPQTLN